MNQPNNSTYLATDTDRSNWSGIAVYVEREFDKINPVTLELIGRAKLLATKTAQKVLAVLIGDSVEAIAQELLFYGVDEVFVYDDKILKDFNVLVYANAFEAFISKTKPSAVLIGATDAGRSLAPRLAARFNTGLTADCTELEISENTDLLQIRPAFGGNIMARIMTPNHRPQFCTIRQRVFSLPDRLTQPCGRLIRETVSSQMADDRIIIDEVIQKCTQPDITDAEVLVAIGQGVKSKDDIAMVEEFAELLHATVACTRPLTEKGWFDVDHQIGLTGKTVKPKLLVAIGISGAMQFTAGIKDSDCIIAINTDRDAPIFEVAHYSLVGDLYKMLPMMIESIKKRLTSDK